MGNALADYLNAVSQDNSDFISAAGSAIELASQIGGVVSTAIAIVNFIENTMNPADAKVLQVINQLTSTLQKDIADVEVQNAQNALKAARDTWDTNIKDAATVFSRLSTYVTDPSLTEDFKQQELDKCFAANLFFTHFLDQWQWAWLDAPKYHDSWSGTIAPPQSEWVFSYTALPYLLQSIYILITSIGALKPSALSAADTQQRFQESLQKLHTVHDTIVSGIMPTKLPQPSDVAYMYEKEGGRWWTTTWANENGWYPYGAVEQYSGASVIDSYAKLLTYAIDPDPAFLAAGALTSLVTLVHLLIAHNEKRLYRSIGLPAVRDAINQLLILTNQDIPKVKPFESWSVREVFATLGLSIPTTGAWQFLGKFLKAIPPYSGGTEAGSLAWHPPVPLPSSFRSLFSPSGW